MGEVTDLAATASTAGRVAPAQWARDSSRRPVRRPEAEGESEGEGERVECERGEAAEKI